jgi:DNA-binding HxlR family transcriptional regulator
MEKVTKADNQIDTGDLFAKNSENRLSEFPACPVMTTLAVIGGKWKPAILWEMEQHGIRRFGQLKKAIGGITQKMLTQQLRELEDDKIIGRKVYAQVPPKVEYSMTAYGKTLSPLLHEMATWGMHHQAIT